MCMDAIYRMPRGDQQYFVRKYLKRLRPRVARLQMETFKIFIQTINMCPPMLNECVICDTHARPSHLLR